MRESDLLSGFLEPTNEGYALAKLAGWKLAESYNRQYGTEFRTVISANLYGPCDNFSEKNSHVIPALLKKFHFAKENGDPTVSIWGSGEVQREFLYVEDLIDACIFLDSSPDIAGPVNVGVSQSTSIKELTFLIREVIDYHGEIKFDRSKPDGAPARKLDTAYLDRLGWQASITLADGLRKTYEWFLRNH